MVILKHQNYNCDIYCRFAALLRLNVYNRGSGIYFELNVTGIGDNDVKTRARSLAALLFWLDDFLSYLSC